MLEEVAPVFHKNEEPPPVTAKVAVLPLQITEEGATVILSGLMEIVKVTGGLLQLLLDIKLPNATGPAPTGMVLIAVLDKLLTTETVLSQLFAIYIQLPSALTDIPSGFVPTGIEAIT